MTTRKGYGKKKINILPGKTTTFIFLKIRKFKEKNPGNTMDKGNCLIEEPAVITAKLNNKKPKFCTLHTVKQTSIFLNTVRLV